MRVPGLGGRGGGEAESPLTPFPEQTFCDFFGVIFLNVLWASRGSGSLILTWSVALYLLYSEILLESVHILEISAFSFTDQYARCVFAKALVLSLRSV